MLQRVQGPECPKCRCPDSLPRGGGRRECDHCGRVWMPAPETAGIVIRVVKYLTPRRGGAECPSCGLLCSPYRTMPDDGGPRIRYFQCDCGERFKSIG